MSPKGISKALALWCTILEGVLVAVDGGDEFMGPVLETLRCKSAIFAAMPPCTLVFATLTSFASLDLGVERAPPEIDRNRALGDAGVVTTLTDSILES